MDGDGDRRSLRRFRAPICGDRLLQCGGSAAAPSSTEAQPTASSVARPEPEAPRFLLTVVGDPEISVVIGVSPAVPMEDWQFYASSPAVI
jgi:hypothetical protein